MNNKTDYRVSDKTIEKIDKNIQDKLGMSLEEYCNLDCDQKQTTLEQYHGRKTKTDHLIWIGGTPYKGYITDKDIDKRLNSVVENGPRQYGEEPASKRPKQFVKRIFNRK